MIKRLNTVLIFFICASIAFASSFSVYAQTNSDLEDVNQEIEAKKKHPDALVVSYVNTKADVKAVSDICCTSANAIKVVQSLPEDKEIIFVPDKNLGRFAKEKTGRNIIIWPGFCHVHHQISESSVLKAKEEHPNAKVIAHPECKPEVLKLADEITSTAGMLTYPKTKEFEENGINEFIVLTEAGMVNKLKRDMPDKEFYTPEFEGEAGICPNMKKTTLEDVYETLSTGRNSIEISEDIMNNARKALNNMLEVK